MPERGIKVYLVLGEASGDKLAADLVTAINDKVSGDGKQIEYRGLAGPELQKQGHKSLFDIDDISVMGISAVMARLPTIISRIYQTVSDIVAEKPDVIVLIDSPDFTHAVAKRVRKKLPDVPIINYVCPSVWAWRSSRARAMRAYVDHVLAILPFEPDVLQKLGGPNATYIGHPLARQIANSKKPDTGRTLSIPTILVLPGSRKSELKRMLQLYGKTLEVLQQRGLEFQAVLPAVPKLKDYLHTETRGWAVQPQIVDSADNSKNFPRAQAAIATSGTVSLELALHRVPTVIGYRLDSIARLFSGLIDTWSAVLPNHILDRIVVPEEHNEMVIPERMARYLERLLADSPERQYQLDSFTELAERMKTKRPPGELAAEIVLEHTQVK
ncbi:MAG: lipid-A-disaccharide synthase [Rhizobiaceae bacterium]